MKKRAARWLYIRQDCPDNVCDCKGNATPESRRYKVNWSWELNIQSVNVNGTKPNRLERWRNCCKVILAWWYIYVSDTFLIHVLYSVTIPAFMRRTYLLFMCATCSQFMHCTHLLFMHAACWPLMRCIYLSFIYYIHTLWSFILHALHSSTVHALYSFIIHALHLLVTHVSYLSFISYINERVRRVWTAEIQIKGLTKTYGLVPGLVCQIQLSVVQSTTLCGAKLWWRGQKITSAPYSK